MKFILIIQVMTQKTLPKTKMDKILKELKLIRNQLQKLLIIIPEETLSDYKNKVKVKNAYLKAVREYPPK